jgi:hypothetical protein
MESKDLAQLALAYSGRYWDLGNGITAFVVIQMLGFLYGLERQELLVQVRKERWLVITATGLSGIIYSSLVMVCHYAESVALQSDVDLDRFASLSGWALVCRLSVI